MSKNAQIFGNTAFDGGGKEETRQPSKRTEEHQLMRSIEISVQ